MSCKHVPLRRCVVCRTQRPQAELLRLYRDENGVWQTDPSSKAGGRGAWLCLPEYDPACMDAPPKRLTRFFRGQAPWVQTQLQQYRQSSALSALTTRHTGTITTE